jgi:hypothetical protein
LAPDPEAAPPAVEPPSAEPAPLALEVDPDFGDDRLEPAPADDERRSSFAQPEPLNTTAGAVIALRIVPSAPQFGQNRGPWSLIPWMTSVTRPQAPQL